MKWLKYGFGAVFTLLILGLLVYFSFDLWGITLFSKEILWKGLLTLGLVWLGFLILLVFGSFFFKNHSKGYQNPENGVAGKKVDSTDRR